MNYVISYNDDNTFTVITTNDTDVLENLKGEIYSAGQFELDSGFIKCSGSIQIGGVEHGSKGPVDETILLSVMGKEHNEFA